MQKQFLFLIEKFIVISRTSGTAGSRSWNNVIKNLSLAQHHKATILQQDFLLITFFSFWKLSFPLSWLHPQAAPPHTLAKMSSSCPRHEAQEKWKWLLPKSAGKHQVSCSLALIGSSWVVCPCLNQSLWAEGMWPSHWPAWGHLPILGPGGSVSHFKATWPDN